MADTAKTPTSTAPTKGASLEELDLMFTKSRVVRTPEEVLKTRRLKPSTKVKFLVEYHGWKQDDAIEAVKKATNEVGFRRGGMLIGSHSYSQLAAENRIED